MMRTTLIFALIAVATAVTIKPLKSLHVNSGLSEVSKTEYEAARASTRNANPQEVSFIEQQEDQEYQDHNKHHYSKKQKRMIAKAKATDDIMYGGQLFQPGPGHDMYFNFAEFSEYAHAHTEMVRRQVAGMTQRSYTNTSGGLTTSEFFMGCIEVNLCANPAKIAGNKNADACIMMGFDGSVTLETKEGKQSLKLSASMSAGVAFHLWGAAMTVYVTGGAEWEFEITGQKQNFYTSPYEAFLGCIKYYISSMAQKKLNLSDKFLQAAQNSRAAIATIQKGDVDATPQLDELTGIVKLHYKFLTNAKAKITAAMPLVDVQTALKKAMVSAVFGTDTATLTAAQAACPTAGKPMDQVLFCTILSNAPTLPSKLQDTSWRGVPKGNDKNFQDGFPELYREVWPTSEAQIPEIVEELTKMAELIGKIQPADWTSFTPETHEVDGKTFTQNIKAKSVNDATENDPCITARSFYQFLAAPSTVLAKAKWVPPNEIGVAFHSKKITLTGTVGATFGSSAVGYCTADENMLQFQIVTEKVYNTETGEWEGAFFGGRVKFWGKFKPGKNAPFFLETSVQTKPTEEDDAMTFAFIFSVPEEGQEGLTKKLVPSEDFLKAAPYVASAVGSILTQLQGLNTGNAAAKKKVLEGGLKKGLTKTEKFKSIMSALGMPVNQGFWEGAKGLGAKVGTAGLKAAAMGLMSDALGVNAKMKTIIEIGLEFACTGVSSWLDCLPKHGPPGNAEIALTLSASFTKVFSITVARNTFYLEFGNNMAYEWTLKEKAELEAE